MGIFISVPKTVECVLTAIAFAVLTSLAVFRQAGVLQSSGYSNGKYFKWLRHKGNLAFTRLVLLAMACGLGNAVLSLCFSFIGEWSAVIGLAPSVLFFIVYIWADKRVALRSEAALTPRFMRLYVVYFLLFAIIAYIFVTLLNFADYAWGNLIFSSLRYCPLALLPLLAIPVLLLANSAAKLYEAPHNKKFIRLAKAKLAASDIRVIAITGSYGKTSTKFILSSILSKKYRVLATPRSHNTPVGIALAVNGNDLKDYDIFIAEMGARHLGDIAELCEICPPDISLITGICGQHLETFFTFENIVRAKSEILGYTRDRAIIADDCFELFADSACPLVRCGCVGEVQCSAEGTDFTLTLGGESCRAHTKLLGAHSAYNIGLAAEAAFAAGMSVTEIAEAAGEIEFIEHRLQLTRANGVSILDDGYNSNVKGARAALEVLKYFGGAKIVITPGLVELGVMEDSENYELGKSLAGFDRVILVGENRIKPVSDGYADGGGDVAKLSVCRTLDEAQEQLKTFIKPGDTVLFLNDLPDIY